MWSSTGLGPPTYRPFEFPYDDYRGGMGEFGSLAGAASWGANPPVSNTIVTSAQEPAVSQDTKSGLVWGGEKPAAAAGSGGGGAGGGTQGLAHWMSVMAEHMNHETSSLHSSYVWNGTESKMSDVGGEGVDGMGVYPRPQSSTSLSPPAPGLVVPQPINPRLPNPAAAAAAVGLHNAAGMRKYPCKMCPQTFVSKADLQLHTQLHLREPKPYKCASCGKAFANSSYLSQHTRIHLGIKPYRCEICQRKFTQLSHLQQHIRTHTGDKPYKCRIPGCTKAFSQLSNLQSHSRCHQTDKPYKCNSCYKCFTEESALLEHIPKHKESKHVKTHICSYCGKSYTQETYLAKHMQKHSDRLDKRAPILAASGQPGSGLVADPYAWSKMDPMAMYGYGGPGLLGGEAESREMPPYSPPWPETPRNSSSAFSPLPLNPTPASQTKTQQEFETPQFPRQNVQEVKSGSSLISLSQIRDFSAVEKEKEAEDQPDCPRQ